MKMKCWSILLLCLIFLSACEKNGPAMYIEPAQLTQVEEDIATLLGADASTPIYDFQLDSSVQSLSINAYALVDGQWDLFYGGGGRVFTDTQGRLALEYDTIQDGIREAVQSAHTSGSSSFISSEPLGLPTGFHRATTKLDQRQEIIYGQEIPLAVQIVTSKNEIRSFGLSHFYHPEEYEKYGYEHVYAITITFRQEPLS